MNHITVIAHGAPHSWIRGVQHDPSIASRLLAACEMALGSLRHDRDTNGGRGYHRTINEIEAVLEASKDWDKKAP